MKISLCFLVLLCGFATTYSSACSLKSNSKDESSYDVLCEKLFFDREFHQFPINTSLESVRHVVFKHSNIPIIPNATFTPLMNLAGLDIIRSNVRVVSPGAFDGLIQLEQINLQSNHIINIPNGIFNSLENLQKLDLSMNYVIYIENNSLVGLSNLKVLNLTRNMLLGVEPDAFKSLTNLEIIDLSYNRMIISQPDFMIKIATQYLQQLYLNNNLFKCFPVVLLKKSNLKVAKFVNLSDNEISSLDDWENPIILIDLSRNHINANSRMNGNVETLIMKWNDLSSLHSYMFIRSQHIHELDLSCNSIEIIETGSFRGLYKLNTLNLAKNKIKYFPEAPFKDLNSLVKLILSYNSLEVLTDDVFGGLKNLEILLLDHNKLTEINSNTLGYLFNLRELYLDNHLYNSGNVPDFFEVLQKLRKIYLYSVKSNCDGPNATKEECFHDKDLNDDTGSVSMIPTTNSIDMSNWLYVKFVATVMLIFVILLELTIACWYYVQFKIAMHYREARVRRLQRMLGRIRVRGAVLTSYTVA